jgi:hypothetical protein
MATRALQAERRPTHAARDISQTIELSPLFASTPIPFASFGDFEPDRGDIASSLQMGPLWHSAWLRSGGAAPDERRRCRRLREPWRMRSRAFAWSKWP